MQKVHLAPTIYDNENDFTDFLALTSDAFISENGSSHQSVFVTPKPLFSDGEARGEDRRQKRKRKLDLNKPLGEQRKTKWRQGNNDVKMKSAVRQVRIERRKIRAVAAENGIVERTLRRYVYISMDPRRQNSGYYYPLQAGEKVPTCLQRCFTGL